MKDLYLEGKNYISRAGWKKTGFFLKSRGRILLVPGKRRKIAKAFYFLVYDQKEFAKRLSIFLSVLLKKNSLGSRFYKDDLRESKKIRRSLASFGKNVRLSFVLPEKPRVSVIILNWNGYRYLKRCLNSLKENTSFEDYEVIIVDNGSSDGSREYLDKYVTGIKVIKNPKNFGFARGNNQAIKITKGADVLLLNNDMVILQKDWLEKIHSLAQSREDIGIVGCRLVNARGKLAHSGTFIYPESYWGQQIGGGEDDVDQYRSNREVEGVVFACAYIKREVIERVGLLDEDYFSYFEDTDYCFKAKGKGYKTFCCGEVTLAHYQNASVKLNKISFPEMFSVAQKVFIGKWGSLFDDKYKYLLGWKSITGLSTGYAVTSRNLMLSLDKQGVDIRYRYAYGPGTPFPFDEPEMCDNYIINLIRARKYLPGDVEVSYCQGDIFYRNSGRYKVGYTMLEVTGIPKEWVEQSNKMDEIWVPSRFNLETFRESRVKVPIHVLPLGIDPDYFNPLIRPFKRSSKFTFLSVFEWGERKNPGLLLKTFSDIFKKHQDVKLVCKIINADRSVNVFREIKNMGLAKGAAEIEIIYNKELRYYEMARMYRAADCFVMPTRGEGWGMPILEAMACGLPVIATDWSAQTEFMDEKNSYPLKVKKLIDARARCPYYKGFQWAEADREHLAHLMKHVFQNRDEAFQKGRNASKEAMEKWTWDLSAQRIIKRLEMITGKGGL